MRYYWLGIALVTAASSTAVAEEPVKGITDITAVTCKDIMSSDDRGRELSMAYMHGYLHGKANSTALEFDKNAAITDKVRDYCLDNPTAKFVETFETLSK
ncbi:MAG: HdeA/HdeB family chaperone [Gammaproteobacteria bacterium]